MKTLAYNDTPVSYEICPCSFMYKDYGLQVRVTLSPKEVASADVFLHNKSAKFEDYENQAKVDVEAFLAKGGLDELLKGQERLAKIREDVEELMESNRITNEMRDDEARKLGMVWRFDAWIHPKSGDDYSIQTYGAKKFTDKDVADLLRGSVIKNDYVITKI